MRKFAFFASLTLCLAAVTALAADMTSYCQQPPSISTAVAPNVLIVLDVSGSMVSDAYSGYSASTTYEGYFDPEKCYTKTGTIWTETAASCSKGATAAPGTDGHGNFLNFWYMSRLDLLRWAMTGGSPSGCAGNKNSVKYCDVRTYEPGDKSLPCDASGCTIQSTGGQNVKARWDRLTGENGGLLYQLRNLPLQPRMGIMLYEGSSVVESVLIGDYTSSNDFDLLNPYKNTIAALNSRKGTGVTPTGPALWAARAYFAQENAIFGGPTPQSGSGSGWKNPLYQCIDQNNNGKCEGNEVVLVPCAKNFIILLSDGEWNMGGKPGKVTSAYSIDVGFADGYSADPVVPAYSMHKLGFVNQPTGIRTSISTLYVVGLWLNSSGTKAMQQTAMYGGFDTNMEWPGGTTGYPMGTSGSYRGSLYTPLPSPSFPDWDKDGNGVPDNYLSAASATEIKNNMIAIINDLLKKASSGTAVSVLGSSDGSGANMLQALFYPKRTFNNGTEVAWTSDLMNYWYFLDPFFSSMQIREDTVREDPDYTLFDLKRDFITSFAYNSDQSKTLASLWEDINGRGSLADATPRGDIPIENSRAIWRAGFNLWWTEPSERTVFTSLDGSTLMTFNTANNTLLAPYLGQSGADAKTTISYVLGSDCADATGAACVCGTTDCTTIGRSRTVTTNVCSARRSPCGGDGDCPSGETCDLETHVWKMGDIISTTPRTMGAGPLNTYNLPTPYGYNDQSYGQFVKSNDHKERQLVFSGTNDGMLHAFKMGKLMQKWPGKKWYEMGRLEGSTGPGGIGTETYAFIPKNVLPYLQYLKDEEYCHIYMVDGPITLTDASINKTSACTQDYWNCPKITTMTAVKGNDVDFANTSWRSVLIGSMGIGGATCNAATPNANRIATPLAVGGQQVGWSSYFALDVTNPTSPQVLWEFSNPDLGVTNIGAGIVKVGGKAKRCASSGASCSANKDCGDDQCVTTNGRWFAVLASGSTGPISNNEFKGTSDNKLRLFILDLKTGELLRTIDTGITNAFAGSISSSTIDLQKNSAKDDGNYQDDALYIGYVRNTTQGGVLRLVINDDINPAHWTVSKVFADGQLGPVTTSVMNLVDRKAKKLWLYFAEGRYFYKQDDLLTQRKLFGVQDPCFNAKDNIINSTCTELKLADLQEQTTPTGLALGKQGWYIELDAADTSSTSPKSSERVISNPTIDPMGAVYFVSFAPTADICGFGGTTYTWSVDYKTGGAVTYIAQGKGLVQVSTGEIKELDLTSSFIERDNRRTAGFLGIPPAGTGIMVVTNPTPIKKFMHIQEE